MDTQRGGVGHQVFVGLTIAALLPPPLARWLCSSRDIHKLCTSPCNETVTLMTLDAIQLKYKFGGERVTRPFLG